MSLIFLDCFCAKTDEQNITVVVFLTCRSFTTWAQSYPLLSLKSFSPPTEIRHQRVEEPFHSTDAFSLLLPTCTRKDVVQETVGTSCTKRKFPLSGLSRAYTAIGQARNNTRTKSILSKCSYSKFTVHLAKRQSIAVHSYLRVSYKGGRAKLFAAVLDDMLRTTVISCGLGDEESPKRLWNLHPWGFSRFRRTMPRLT